MKKFIPVFLFAFLALPLIASAYVEPQVVICNLLNKVKVIIAAVGFGIAVIMLIVGGIKYMTSQGDAEKAKSARSLIVNALIGIAIIVGAVFILQLVEGFLVGGNVMNPVQNPCGSY